MLYYLSIFFRFFKFKTKFIELHNPFLLSHMPHLLFETADTLLYNSESG